MESAVVMVIVAAALLAWWQRSRLAPISRESRAIGQALHLRTGEFSSSCSWCKNTALARKLLVFSRSSGAWSAVDVMGQLFRASDAEVVTLSSVFHVDQPQSRRFCTERCAKEFFSAEQVTMTDSFESCEYCSTRSPAALPRCPNCGAGRRARSRGV